MIEIANNIVKCNMNSREPPERSNEQENLYQEVIEAFAKANKLFDLYKHKYGTDQHGISRILKSLNGG